MCCRFQHDDARNVAQKSESNDWFGLGVIGTSWCISYSDDSRSLGAGECND